MNENKTLGVTEGASNVSSVNTTESINFRPKTVQERKTEAKKRRTEKIIGAIGDGLMSLSNLFFTSKGAPPQFGKTDGTEKNRRSNPTFLTTAISERIKAEDKEYEERYNKWEEQQRKDKEALLAQQKIDAKNRRFQLTDDFGILESNWGNEDFVNQLFGAIEEWNIDPKLKRTLDSFHYRYEPIWEWMGSNWVYEDGHDKKIDMFKGKTGTYLKRDLIETLFGDENWTTPENRANLIKLITEFENYWIPIK